MFSFLLFLLIFCLVIVLFVVSFIGRILQTLFGTGKRNSRSYTSHTHTGSQSYENKQRTNTSKAKKHKKIFEKDEGEYVDFEEVE